MDMNDPLFSSPGSSSTSDSDAYNTESARVYFGPLKTPERKFVAASKHLFPPTNETPLRRSPRLSSPRARSVTPADSRQAQEDLEDMKQVDELVIQGDNDEEDGNVPDSVPDTPPNMQVVPDEPSSALAERIMHALDNPSPPPSPPLTLSLFDPYHAAAQESSNDYQADLMSLSINDHTNQDVGNSLPVFSPAPLPMTPSSTNATTKQPLNIVVEPQDLISFDSFPTPPRVEVTDNAPQPIATLSVDDLLSQSPGALGLAESPPAELNTERHPISSVVIEEAPPDGTLGDDFPMAVDAAKQDHEAISETAGTIDQVIVGTTDRRLGDIQADTPLQIQESLTQTLEPVPSPLRRSTRPRKSVTPNTNLNPPIARSPALPATPSSARTQVKKRLKSSEPNDEVVNDSQDEDEDISALPSPAPTVVRMRHRSPSKTPMSFKRELGSLSPTSSNLLAGLAFTPAPDNGDSTDAPANPPESSDAQPMFSFSVFAPPSEPAGPSTPVRSAGPVRLASPTKITTPAKFGIQTAATNNATSTPARRIPISEAIAQGQISPQKAAQLGYKPNGTSSTSVPTPARRVLITEPSAPPSLKSTPLRYASPIRALPAKRGLSTEPVHRVTESVKGKEKALPAQGSSSIVAELPYPLIPLSSRTSPVPPSSTTQGAAQEAAVSKASPAKPALKQVTSKIPRIGRKPYMRPAEPKAGEKSKSATSRLVNQVKKPPSRTPTPDLSSTAARRNISTDSAKPGGKSTLRTKTDLQTSAAVLKRKREPERSSPEKPRVITVRQVPSLPSSEPSKNTLATAVASTSKVNKATPAPVRFRRVLDTQPSALPPPAADFEPLEPTSEPALPTIICRPRPPTPEVSSSEELSLAHVQINELTPGSPMKQDTSCSSHEHPDISVGERSSGAEILPVIVVTEDTTVSEPPSMGLRRTTRSRRSTSLQDGASEPLPRSSTSRRKPPVSRFDDVFSGMSLTALKDLTASNTVRNQQYLAAKLETEVIRKEGARPESPAVKIKTIVQREQDQKDKQRAERAMRRARRSDEMNSSDIEGMTDLGYSSAVEDGASDDEKGVMKHRRGAGEEEDYETPDRPVFNIKPTRLFGDVDMDSNEVQPKRHVKWDRGLYTTVYLDEVKLGSRQTLKENRSLKGILAPTAKAVRLDTLGNLPHADSPLVDLIQENITVKKFVYDSDLTPAAPEIIVKNTRSKGKKK